MKTIQRILLRGIFCLLFLSGNITSKAVKTVAAPDSVTGSPPQAMNVALVGHIGGSAEAVFVQGSYAYVGFGPELAVLDVSDPTQIKRVGYLTFANMLADVFVSGDYAYVILTFGGFAVIDVSVPAAPVIVAALEASAFAGAADLSDLEVSGETAYLCDQTAGLWVVDISDPFNPFIAGGYFAAGAVKSVALAGNLAYLGTSYGSLKVLDVSHPANPVELGEYWSRSFPYNLAVVVTGDTVYVGGSYGLWILDVSNPAQPVEVGKYQFGIESPAALIDLAIAVPDAHGKRLAYLTTDTCGLVVVDVTDPAHPAMVAFSYPESTSSAIAISDGYVYLVDTSAGLRVFLTPIDPHGLAEIGSYDSPGWASTGELTEGYYYLADGSAGLRVIDVTDPQAPVEAGSFTDQGSVVDIAVGSLDTQGKRYAYLVENSDGEGRGLRVMDVSDPAQPVPAGFYPCQSDPTTVAIGDDHLPGERYIYLSEEYHGINEQYVPPVLRILDVSDPTQPVSAGTFTDEDGWMFILGIAVGEVDSLGHQFVYLIVNDRVDVVDVSDPANTEMIAAIEIIGSPTDLVLAGNTLYVSSGYNAVTLVDITNPGSPIVLGASGFVGGKIVVSNQKAYVTTRSGGESSMFIVYDLSDPTQPFPFTFATGYPYLGGVAVDGDHAYVAGGQDGLRVLAISGLSPLNAHGTYDTIYSANSLAIQDNYAYMSSGVQNGLDVVDISDRRKPIITGFVAINYQVFDVAVQGSYAYLATLDRGLQVVDVADPANPVLAGSSDSGGPWTSVIVSGTYAYLGGTVYSTALAIVDISDPQKPVEIGRWEAPDYGGIWNIALSAQYAYVPTESGLRVIDVSDPANPMEAGSYPGSGMIAITMGDPATNPYAYVAEAGGLRILNISNLADLKEVAFYRSDQHFNGSDIVLGEIDAHGHRYVSLAGGYDGLLIIDVTDPAHPVEAGYFNSPGYAADVEVAGSEVFLVDGDGGVYILSFSGFTVTGQITHANGWPYSGITLALGGIFPGTSGEGGIFSIDQLPPDTYSLAPVLTGFTSIPVSRMVTLPPNANHQDFTILAQPVSTVVESGVPTSLVYTDTQGLPTQLDFPAGAITQTITGTQSVMVVLTPTIVTHSSLDAFTGHAFELGVIEGGWLQSGFVFSQPVTVTVTYNELDTWAVSDVNGMLLKVWEGDGWVDAAETCAPASAYQRDLDNKLIRIRICRAGRYALFGATYTLMLPQVTSNWP